MFFSQRLYDDDIKRYIAETSTSTWFAVVLYIAFGVFVSTVIVMITPDDNLQEMLSWVACGVMIAFLWKVVSAQVKREQNVMESLTDEHLRASLSYGTFHKLAPNFFESKRNIRYYVKFKDENGRMRKCSISESEDKRIYHEYKKGQRVIVLKYPKYKGYGFKYVAFDEKTFVNKSSLPFTNSYGEDW